jgi:hypothetical protein
VEKVKVAAIATGFSLMAMELARSKKVFVKIF